MANANPKTPAPNANPADDEGKVPARPVDAFESVMDALANAGSARGLAITSVCEFLNKRTFDSADVADFDALSSALKVAKMPKIAKVVSSILTVVKIGGSVDVPTLNPVDYK